jgi:hypothetical protein
VEDGKIKEFNCYVSVNVMLEQTGIQPFSRQQSKRKRSGDMADLLG